MDTPGVTRVIGYTRVSTEESNQSGLGLDAQEAKIRRAAEYREWEIVDLIRDGASSGKDLGRPVLRSSLERLLAREADALVVAKLDRLSRSQIDLLSMIQWCTEAGIGFVSLDLDLDTSTPIGGLMMSVIGAFAQLEREWISERTKAGMAVLRERGLPLGHPGVRDSNPEAADFIKTQRDAGATWQSIADALNARGVPTVRGAAKWTKSALQTAAGYQRPPKRRAPINLPEIPRIRAQYYTTRRVAKAVYGDAA